MFPRKTWGFARWACAALLLLFSLGPAFAEQQKKKQRTEKPKEEESSTPYDAATRARSGDAITNEDLERMMEERPDLQLGDLPPTTPPAPRPAPAKLSPKAKGQPQPKPQSRAQSKPQPQARTQAQTKPAVRRVTPTFIPVPRSQGTRPSDSRVAALESRVAELEKAILATNNPALPRAWLKPQGIPPGGPKDWETLLRRSREELSAARHHLARRASSP